MSNNIGGVVNIYVFLVAMLGDDVLTLLNHSGSNYNFMFFMTNLFMVALFFMNNIICKGTLGLSSNVSSIFSLRLFCF